jgi:hypothetical protein
MQIMQVASGTSLEVCDGSVSLWCQSLMVPVSDGGSSDGGSSDDSSFDCSSHLHILIWPHWPPLTSTIGTGWR